LKDFEKMHQYQTSQNSIH